MPMGRISDEFFKNRKVLQCISMPGGLEAIGLWTVADSWCNSELTDGHVPEYALRVVGGNKKLAACLVACGLWLEVEGGYQFHDWGDFNDLRDGVLEKRAKESEKRGHRRAAERATKALTRTRVRKLSGIVSAPDNQADTHNVSGGVSEAPDPDPDPDQRSPLPPSGASASAGQEVREGWASAWFAAKAGTMPVLSGQTFAAAVEFARQVAKTHDKPLHEAARAIAAHVLKHNKTPRDIPFDLARVDPYATAPGGIVGQPRQVVFPVGLP